MTISLRKILSPPSTNYHLEDATLDPYKSVVRGGTVVDVGGGTARGYYSVTKTPARDRALRVVTLDLFPGPAVDVCADAHALPFRDQSIDCVMCVSVLEYVSSPTRVIAEIERVLRPGGIVYLSAPFVFPHHPPPDDRFRFSMSGLRTLTASRFDEIRVGYSRGPASTFCHLLVHFVAIVLSCGSERLYGALVDIAKWLLFWVKYLDRWIGRYPSAHVLHGSAYFLGSRTSVISQSASFPDAEAP